jgi:hypothetical protein
LYSNPGRKKGMGITVAAAGVVQASLPFYSGEWKGCDIKRARYCPHPYPICCHGSSSSSEGGENRTSSNMGGITSGAGKRLQNYLEFHRGKANINSNVNANSNTTQWDWDRWQEHFSEVDEHETLSSVLKLQLEEAVESEDFQEASRLKRAIAAAMEKDTIADVMAELKKSIEEERYWDAARIRDDAGAGLVGWWVGLPQGPGDPYGRIIQIVPGQGRFVAKSYSARQLANAAPGVPLFEIFVTKDGVLGYRQQAVYLRRARGTSGDSLQVLEAEDANLLGSSKSVPEGNKKYNNTENPGDVEKGGDKGDDMDLREDGLNRVLNFLRERIPGIKFKILKVIAPEGAEMDTRIFEELMQDNGKEKDEEIDSGETSEDEIKIEGDLQDDKVTTGGDSDFSEKRKEIPIKLVIGGVLQSSSEDKTPPITIRVPARIEYKRRDVFVFHTEEKEDQQKNSGKEKMPELKVATIAAQASAELMPPDVAKVFWNAEKGPIKVPRDIKEIIKLAVSQAQKRNGLFGSTMFHRIDVSEASADPLSGLYIGAFGPYTSEVVDLRRKYGHWHNVDESLSEDANLEFFEYVEAVKLIGDLNVPAGKVTFRAKIGKENRLSNHGIYPEELGVVARYKGQGRMAEPGFHNPQWIDGELVLLDGKASAHTNGAELGFVYSVPERHFLILFNRLKLQQRD